MKTTIREIQNKGYKKTTVKGLYLTNKGEAYNIDTNNHLRIARMGKVIVKGKEYNLAKLILETYKKIPVRKGAILFLNGNNSDYSLNNIKYATGTHYKAPSEANIIKCIRLYFEVDKNINRTHIFFKMHLKAIALKRGFLCLHNEKDFKLFLSWIEPFSKSKSALSVDNGYTVINGTDAINKYLSMLVSECLKDYELGLLKIIDFAPKPLTTREKNIKTNEVAKMAGLNIKVPLRNSNIKKK